MKVGRSVVELERKILPAVFRCPHSRENSSREIKVKERKRERKEKKKENNFLRSSVACNFTGSDTATGPTSGIMYLRCLVGFAGIRRKAARHLADERAALCGHSRRIRRNVIIVINVIVLFAVIVVGVMHVCDRARGDCKRSPACTVYGDGNATASLRINMLARQNDTDFCGVYINDVSYSANLVSFSQSD